MPDTKTLARLEAIGPEAIRELHERLVELAQERGIVKGQKMRVDTTVVEANIHYPTDSSLLGTNLNIKACAMPTAFGPRSTSRAYRDRPP